MGTRGSPARTSPRATRRRARRRRSSTGGCTAPSHRANILRPGFDEIGIAIAEDGDLAIYVTTFGRR
jgi:hypothetical protein